MDDAGNSFSIAIDDEPEQILGNTGEIGPWIWIEGPRLRIAKGRHTIRVRTREDGSRIRSLRLTSTPADRPAN